MFTEFVVPSAAGWPHDITTGPDGNLWFTEEGGQIGRITTAGVITEYVIPTASSDPSVPYGITTGPDGNLWFTEVVGNKIGQVTTSGVITEISIPEEGCVPGSISCLPYDITVGPDGNLWFTEFNGNKVGRLAAFGVYTGFVVPTTGAGPREITTGPDGNLWFTEVYANKIGKLTLPSPTPTATNTPATANDCCQCPTSCAAPINGSCGSCVVVFNATCESGDLCVLHTPAPTLSPRPTLTPTPSPTPTLTPTPTPSLTPTPTPANDCCQCASFCAAPIVGTCGGCAVVFGASCTGGLLCVPRTPTPTPIACVGDCNGNGVVTVDEILTMVNIALGNADATACPNGIPSGAQVDVALILTAVNNALNGCGGS